MKNIFAILIMILCLGGAALSVRAEDPPPAENIQFTFEVDEDENAVLTNVVIADTAEPMSALEIPEEDGEGHPVSLIKENAFSSCSDIETLVLPENLISVEKGFLSGSGFTRLIVNSNLTGSEILYDSSIQNLIFAKGQTSVPDRFATGCNTLTSVVLNQGVERIGKEAFSYCQYLASVTGSDALTEIEDNAFTSCSSLNSFCAVKGAKIGAHAFDYCTSLEEFNYQTDTINTPDATIGDYAFANCSSLKRAVVGDHITNIGEYAYINCTSLETAILKNASVGDNCFYRCPKLSQVIWPSMEGATTPCTIGDQAFFECSALQQLKFSDNLSSIGERAFFGCSKLKGLQNLTNEEWTLSLPQVQLHMYAFYQCTSLENVQFYHADKTSPETVIGFGAFFECSNIKTVTFTDDIKYIGFDAFYGCSSLKECNLPKSLISLGTDPLYPDMSKGFSFGECTSLSTITWPDHLEAIGDGTFSGCTALTQVNVPETVTTIGTSAFAGCSTLTSVRLPSGLTEIAPYLFNGCSSLPAINLPANIDSLGAGAFQGCTSMTAFTFPVNVTTISDYLFAQSGLTAIEIPARIRAVGENAFKACSALANISLENGMTEIGFGAFSNCTELRSLTIPDSVTTIQTFAFANCTKLSELKLPAGLQYLGGAALSNTFLHSFKVKQGVTYDTYHVKIFHPETLSTEEHFYGILTGSPVDYIQIEQGAEVPELLCYQEHMDGHFLTVDFMGNDAKIGKQAFYNAGTRGLSLNFAGTAPAQIASDAFGTDNREQTETAFAYHDDRADTWKTLGQSDFGREILWGAYTPSGGGESPTKPKTTAPDFVAAHISFLENGKFRENMDNRYSDLLYHATNTIAKNAAENMYNILKTPSELLDLNVPSTFSNPYDAVLIDLLMSQTEKQATTFEVEFQSEQAKAAGKLYRLLEVAHEADTTHSVDAWNPEEYRTVVEQLFDGSRKVNDELFNNADMLTSQFISGKQDLLHYFSGLSRFSEFLDDVNNYTSVIEWVVACANYNSAVNAYLATSEEFRQTLDDALTEMRIRHPGSEYTGLYEQALNRYSQFMEDNLTAADVALMLNVEYFRQGFPKILEAFGETISENAQSYLTTALGLSESTAGTVFAVIKAYKVGMTLGDALTSNDDIVNCREFLRAWYYLSDSIGMVVEYDASRLRSSKTLQNARKFDASFSALKTCEIQSFIVYDKMLAHYTGEENEPLAFLYGVFQQGKQKQYVSDRQLIQKKKVEWEYADCHPYPPIRISGGDTPPIYRSGGKITVVTIACPTDVHIYNKEDQLLLSIENNEIVYRASGIAASVANGVKNIALHDRENCRIEISAFDQGSMDYQERLFDDAASEVLLTAYDKISLNKGDIFLANADPKTGEPVLTKDDAPLVPDSQLTLHSDGSVTDRKASSAGDSVRPGATGADSGGVAGAGTAGAGPENVKVSRIILNGISHKIAAGRKIKLKATVRPANAANKKMKWSSSNKKIATVTQTGLVKINKKAGGKSVKITADSTDGSGRKAVWKIKVMKGTVRKITVKGYSKTLKAGKTMKMKAVVKTSKGKPVNKKLKWTSSNLAYATVTQAGKVKALKKGKGKTVTITVTATDGSPAKVRKKVKIR